MIVDTSALLAILRQEPDAQAYADALAEAPICRISAGTFLEACIVVDTSKNPITRRRLEDIIEEAEVIIEPVTYEHALIGRIAYRDYGKGSRHPAHLNYGDCFAYALARATGEPLLYKGDDFSHTDLKSAL